MLHKLLCVLSLVFVFQSELGYAGEDALEEVNRLRASRGLAPFLRDEALTQAASRCADHRAAHLIAGHSSNDFGFLPAGAHASAAGCAAWPAHMGWGSCCSHENWRYAGAAYSLGRDGRRYMQLFVSNSPNSQPYRDTPLTGTSAPAPMVTSSSPESLEGIQYYQPQQPSVRFYAPRRRR